MQRINVRHFAEMFNPKALAEIRSGSSPITTAAVVRLVLLFLRGIHHGRTRCGYGKNDNIETLFLTHTLAALQISRIYSTPQNLLNPGKSSYQ